MDIVLLKKFSNKQISPEAQIKRSIVGIYMHVCSIAHKRYRTWGHVQCERGYIKKYEKF